MTSKMILSQKTTVVYQLQITGSYTTVIIELHRNLIHNFKSTSL